MKIFIKRLRCFKNICDHFCVHVRHTFQYLIPHMYCEYLTAFFVFLLNVNEVCVKSGTFFVAVITKKRKKTLFHILLVHIHALI